MKPFALGIVLIGFFAAISEPTPTLDTAEKTALEALEQQKQQAQQAMMQATQQEVAIGREFTVAHPGYHINLNNFSIEKDPPKTPEKK